MKKGNVTIYEWNDEENSWVELLPEKLAEGDVLINEANFPDELFRSYVVNNIDTSKDGILSKDEADEITKLYLGGWSGTDLKGIEYFTKLQYLEY